MKSLPGGTSLAFSITPLVCEQRGLPERLLAAYGTGIQIHVEHLDDHLHGRELCDVDARWSELLPAYEALPAGG